MFFPLKNLLQKRRHLRPKKSSFLEEISFLWNQVVGGILQEENSAKARVLNFKNDVLYIKTDKNALKFLLPLKEKLVIALNKKTKEEVVKKIIFKVD
jgi:hypothetical protein